MKYWKLVKEKFTFFSSATGAFFLYENSKGTRDLCIDLCCYKKAKC